MSISVVLALIGFVFLPLAAAATGAVVRAARPDPGRTRGTALQIVVTIVLVVAGQLLVALLRSAIVHALVLIPALVGALMARPRGWRRAVRGAMFGSFVAAIGLLVLYLLMMVNFINEVGASSPNSRPATGPTSSCACANPRAAAQTGSGVRRG